MAAVARVWGCLAWLLAAWPSEAAGPVLLAIGDWGGLGNWFPTTPPQVDTAAGMADVARRMGATAALLLGDNFYQNGVPEVHCKRFQETFEGVYSQEELEKIPFWVVAGNHDHRGNVSAQIAYSGVSQRWRFPSEYYNLTYGWTTSSGETRTAEILMIDTVRLAGLSDDACQGCPLPGPQEALRAESQWSWLEARLSTSTADFLWVAGHYPVYSAGSDGTTEELVNRLLPLLQRHNAHYISGHDHMLEHITFGAVQMFVTGAGMECCYLPTKRDTVPSGALKYMISGPFASGPSVGKKPSTRVSGGFATMEFLDESVQVAFHDQHGAELYAAPAIPRRSPAEALVV